MRAAKGKTQVTLTLTVETHDRLLDLAAAADRIKKRIVQHRRTCKVAAWLTAMDGGCIRLDESSGAYEKRANGYAYSR